MLSSFICWLKTGKKMRSGTRNYLFIPSFSKLYWCFHIPGIVLESTHQCMRKTRDLSYSHITQRLIISVWENYLSFYQVLRRPEVGGIGKEWPHGGVKREVCLEGWVQQGWERMFRPREQHIQQCGSVAQHVVWLHSVLKLGVPKVHGNNPHPMPTSDPCKLHARCICSGSESLSMASTKPALMNF